jgi:hypothetical protein
MHLKHVKDPAAHDFIPREEILCSSPVIPQDYLVKSRQDYGQNQSKIANDVVTNMRFQECNSVFSVDFITVIGANLFQEHLLQRALRQ